MRYGQAFVVIPDGLTHRLLRHHDRHAETGRLWQSREFWEKADAALAADGELARLHDAYRVEAARLAGMLNDEPAQTPTAVLPALVGITLHWSDGTTTSASPVRQPPG